MSEDKNDGTVMIPLLACNKILFAGLCSVWRDRELLDHLDALFLREESIDKARALFDYLFVPTDGPTMGTDNRGVGFRLRDPIQRLRHAEEIGFIVGTG